MSDTRLEAGFPAPTFQCRDLFDNEIRLEDYRNKQLLLSFFRYAGCPLCNLRIRHLSRRYEELNRAGLHVVAFFESPKESILKTVGKQSPPFPIVPDPERRIYDLYGVTASWKAYFKVGLKPGIMVEALLKERLMPGKMEGKWAMVPADFLIGPDLLIYEAFYGKDISEHMPLEQVERFLGMR